jgi:hypothetical protein
MVDFVDFTEVVKEPNAPILTRFHHHEQFTSRYARRGYWVAGSSGLPGPAGCRVYLIWFRDYWVAGNRKNSRSD